MTEVIMLDPFSLAGSSRDPLELTNWVDAESVNWGDAEISAFMADMIIGSSPVDYRIPNRVISIPLNLRDVGAVTFAEIRASLQQKVGLFQREQGWLMRQIGSTALYADVVNATLHLGGSWLQAFRDLDPDAVLQLECLPEWYGDEVALDAVTGTSKITAVLQESSADALIAGNHPGRVRIAVSDTSGHDQHGLLWGLRSKNYSADSTAALFYEGEALTALDAAATHVLSGASGGSTMRHNSLPAGSWCPVLSTGFLTHTGSYRVWARVYSATATPTLKFLWDVGDLTAPTENTIVQVPAAAGFYLIDFGEIVLNPSPVGTHRWQGVIQALADVQDDPIEIDCLYLQPLNETAGRLTAVQTSSALGVLAIKAAGAGSDDSGVGTVTWSNPGNITADDGLVASCTTGGGTITTHYLKSASHGFAVPTGATISGIKVEIKRTRAGGAAVTDARVRLAKAGTVQATDRADTVTPWPTGLIFATKTYGSATDLWGTTWSAADINNSGFGVAIAAKSLSGQLIEVGFVRITVYYTTSGGFTTTPDAVIYASQTAELRTDGMYRKDSTGTAYGPISKTIGSLPRLSASGSEARQVQLFLRTSRSNLDNETDAGLDALTCTVTYRPCYLITP